MKTWIRVPATESGNNAQSLEIIFYVKRADFTRVLMCELGKRGESRITPTFQTS